MRTEALYFGIDFGTTNSSMAWYDPETERAWVLRNGEGEEQTPSVVYYREDGEVLVGKDAEDELDDVERSGNLEERAAVSQRIVKSIKRNLLEPPFIPIPGREPVEPVEVVSQVVGKLKRDAQEDFNEEIERVIITCPATFDEKHRDVLREGAYMAGFRTVEVLEEPTAAAITVTKQGQKIGNGILIYDLGAGTFDLSVAVRGDDGSFYIPIEPQGDTHCGGNDLDLELYNYCDEIARKELGRPISLAGDLDLVFLKQCTSRKENLTKNKSSRFSSYLPSENGSQRFKHEVERETFEDLIRPRIEKTVEMTAELWNRVKDRADAVILIGGSSRVPLVRERLGEALQVEPRQFAGKDYAVALGAAYQAYERWGRVTERDADKEPEEIKEYRRALKSCWNDRWLKRTEAEWIDLKKYDLMLSPDVAAWVERDELGYTINDILRRQEPLARDRYSRVLELGWKDRALAALQRVPTARLNMLLDDRDRFCEFDFADCPVSAAERREMAGGLPWSVFAMVARVATDPNSNAASGVDGLAAIADELGLSKQQAAAVEHDVLGSALEQFLRDPSDEYRKAVETAQKEGITLARIKALKASAGELGLSKDQPENIEQEIMGDTAFGIWAENNEVTELIKRHGVVRARVKGSGRNGRITKRDVEAHIEEQRRNDEPLPPRKRQIQSSALSGRLDAFGDGFVGECRADLEHFMDTDPKWAKKREELGRCFTSAVESYERKVEDAVQEEVRKIRDLEVPRFSVSESGANTGVSVKKGGATKIGAGVGLVTVFLGDPGIVGPLIGGAVGGAIGKRFGSDPKQKTLEAAEKTAREAVPLLRKEAETYVSKVNDLLTR